MKIAVYYDTLVNKGGAERVAIELANKLDADIITSGYNVELSSWLNNKQKIIDISNFILPFFNPIGTLFEAPLRYFFNKERFIYDINIFIGFSSIYASKKSRTNFWLCLTPNRMLYDLKKDKITKGNIFARLIFFIYSLIFSIPDILIAKNNFKVIVAQNSIVQERIRKYYQKKSTIIHSPVDTTKYYFQSFEPFYLCVSRLFPEKRVDIIAKSFAKMPNKKLIIVGDGPEKNTILKIISKNPNIELKSNISEKELLNLYSRCMATIYIPFNEDFGLTPIEGMASGKICIGVNEGGLRESIIEGKTGFYIKPTETDIMNIVTAFNQKQAILMKEDCIRHAFNFDLSIFTQKWKKLLQEV